MQPIQGQTDSVGIEVTRSLLRVAVLSKGAITSQREIAVGDSSALLPAVLAAISGLKDTAANVGIAVSGLVSRQSNRVILSKQLPEFTATDIAAELSAQTGTRILIENDANAAAFGEYTLGAGRGSRSMFFTTIGEGIGGALILNNEIWRGASGYAGEFGHIAIDEDGIKLEEVASSANIVRRAKERLYHDSTSSLSRRQLEQATTIDDIVNAAKNGDDFAQMMMERTGAYIGTAIASVINLLNVERIVIGGEVMEAERVIIESIIRRARERSFPPSFESARIVAAELGTGGAAIGAALFASQL